MGNERELWPLTAKDFTGVKGCLKMWGQVMAEGGADLVGKGKEWGKKSVSQIPDDSELWPGPLVSWPAQECVGM